MIASRKKMRRKWKWETSSLLQENSIGTYLYMSSVFFSLLLIVSLENQKRNIRAKNRTVSRESKVMRLHCLIGTASPPTILKVQKILWTFLNNLIMRAKHLCCEESHWFFGRLNCSLEKPNCLNLYYLWTPTHMNRRSVELDCLTWRKSSSMGMANNLVKQ